MRFEDKAAKSAKKTFTIYLVVAVFFATLILFGVFTGVIMLSVMALIFTVIFGYLAKSSTPSKEKEKLYSQLDAIGNRTQVLEYVERLNAFPKKGCDLRFDNNIFAYIKGGTTYVIKMERIRQGYIYQLNRKAYGVVTVAKNFSVRLLVTGMGGFIEIDCSGEEEAKNILLCLKQVNPGMILAAPGK